MASVDNLSWGLLPGSLLSDLLRAVLQVLNDTEGREILVACLLLLVQDRGLDLILL